MTITIKFSDNIEHNYNSFEEIIKLDNYNDIIYLDCWGSSLFSLPELPNSLQVLWCNYNNLSSLPELPNSLERLYCATNNLSSLPKLPNSLNYFSYNTNPIFIYIKKYFEGDREKYFEYEMNMKKKFTNKIEIWFLDCKYNPKYKYCRKRLMKEYNELYN